MTDDGSDVDISVVVASRPNRAPDEDLQIARVADRLGYAEVWVGEGWVWDPFALATAIGLATQRCRLTVGPVPVAVRDPVVIAMSAASTAALIGRPVGVALGTSSVRFVERLHGRSRRRPAATLAESAQAVRSLLSGQQTDFDGEMLSAHGQLRLAPPGGPLTVAAFGNRATAVAAAFADRMVLDLVSPDLAAEFRVKLDAAAAEAGRTPPPRLAAWIPAAVDPDPASYAELKRNLTGYLEVAGYSEMFRAAGLGEAVDLAADGADADALLEALPDDAATRIGVVGDTAAVRDRLDAYAEAGLDEVVLVPATAGDPRGERTLTAIAGLRDAAR